MHVESYKQADVKRLVNEWERRPEYKCRDGRIDPSKTPFNYSLGGGHSVEGSLPVRLNEVQHSTRKDLNVLSDWVVTCPQELVGDKAKEKRFFDLTYKFMQDRYGPENVLQGHVHMDETTPHAHICFVPVKDGRVSAKALLTRKELRDIHTDLDRVMAVEFGQKGLIRNGRTKGNYTVQELKERSEQERALGVLQGEVTAEAKRYMDARALRQGVEASLSDLEQRAGELQGSLEKAADGPLTVSERELLDYMKICKRKDGRTAYEFYGAEAAAHKRRQLQQTAKAASVVKEKAKPKPEPTRSAQSKQLSEAKTVDEILAAGGFMPKQTLREVSAGEQGQQIEAPFPL